MAIVDYDAIINGTPQKVLLNGFRSMKENYTEESAQEYSALYKNQPLSFITENSRYIFSESYVGLPFYKEIMEDASLCNFTVIEKELDKVESFIEENGDQMDTDQRKLYNDLVSSLKTVLEHTINTRIYANYIKESIDPSFEEKLSDFMYEYKTGKDTTDEIYSLFKESNNTIINMTYAPYVSRMENISSLNQIVSESLESTTVDANTTEEEWKTYIETVICANKLSYDDLYKESMNSIYNVDETILLEHFMNTSLEKKLEELVEERVDTSDIYHVSPESAVNNLFFEAYESELDAEENEEFKNKIERFKAIAYESSLDTLVREYQMVDDTEVEAKGYSLLTESLTLDDAFNQLNSLYQESTEEFAITESEDDVTDDDIDNIDSDIKGEPTGKKPQAPKAKNLATKIQNSAMDKEAKRNVKKAKLQQKGQEIKDAAIAATALPRSLIQGIKNTTRKFDEADDERRKRYMTEPGFRKKAFRNLKLAIMYGGAAHVKLSLVPVLAMCRHFSKQKDVRIRNELVRELETELSVCEEKINDANAKGDEREKYRLMRIRDRLKTEITRVKLNSRYV